jgi:hypothetical protein
MWRFTNSVLTLLAAAGTGWSLAQWHIVTALIYAVFGVLFYKTLEKDVFKD